MRWFGSKIPSLMYGVWFIGGVLALAAFGLFIIDLDGGRLSPLEINTFIVTPALKAAIVGVIWIGGLVAGGALLRRGG
jgi:hypothetical protein